MISVTCHAIVTKPYCLYFRNSDSVPFSSSLPPAPSSKVQAGLPGFLQSSCNWGSGIYPAFPPLFLPLQGRVIFSKCQWILSPFKDPHYSLPRSTKIPSIWLWVTNPNPVLFQTTFLLSHPLFSSHTRFLSIPHVCAALFLCYSSAWSVPPANLQFRSPHPSYLSLTVTFPAKLSLNFL